MILQYLVIPRAGTNKPASLFCRSLARLAFAVAAAALPFQHATAASGGVYVSGKGTGLDQAITQALADHPRKTATPFWIVISGPEIARVTKRGASPGVIDAVNKVRSRGGLVYVCRTDLVHAGHKESELLDGVVAMYGYDAKDWAGLLPARKEGITLPDNMEQSQMILKTCGGEGSSAK